MSVISAAEIDQASGTIVVSPRDIVTPLARERAKDRGIKIEVRSSGRPDTGRTETQSYVRPDTGRVEVRPPNRPDHGRGDRRDPQPTGPQPMSGTLYRRGAPVPGPLDVHGTSARNDRRPRVAVVGAGHVGAMTALRLAETSLFSTATLIDIAPGLAAGLALDMWHSASLRGFNTRIEGTEDLASGLRGARYIVVTAGRPRQPGMSRTDLTKVNAEIVEQVARGIKANAKDAVVVVVTNPLEEMTALTARVTGFPDRRVIGMAGVLDSARFCTLVALTGACEPRDVRALALGSHGPEMVIPLSNATIRGKAITEVLPRDQLRPIVERARDSGAEVVGLLKKGSAYFSPAESAAAMVTSMVQGRGEVIAACVRSEGAYGLVDTRVGLPVKLGRDGVSEIVKLSLTPEERDALAKAAKSLQERISALDA